MTTPRPARPARTQVGIIGAGPAGLLLSQLLGVAGVESVLVETRSQAYCEARQRAGVLEQASADLLRELGVGERLDAEGLVHGGIYLQFAGERHHVDFPTLAGGRGVTLYAQTEVVKDLVAARLRAGQELHFEVTETALRDLDSDRPVLSFRDSAGIRREVSCDAIAGCDGFHGISRAAIPADRLQVWERAYPFAWLGVLAEVAPSTDELIYAHSPLGFAMHSMRGPEVSRLYLQVDPEENLAGWSDERIWEQLHRRLELPGWTLHEGPLMDRSITAMRSFVAGPMRHGRLFLAGDAAHIVPPTGAKGLNLAIADVKILADALVSWLRRGDPRGAQAYSDTCLDRVWRTTYFSWWMTSMLHRFPDDPFSEQLQLAQLRSLVGSEAALATLAQSYVGLPLPPR